MAVDTSLLRSSARCDDVNAARPLIVAADIPTAETTTRSRTLQILPDSEYQPLRTASKGSTAVGGSLLIFSKRLDSSFFAELSPRDICDSLLPTAAAGAPWTCGPSAVAAKTVTAGGWPPFVFSASSAASVAMVAAGDAYMLPSCCLQRAASLQQQVAATHNRERYRRCSRACQLHSQQGLIANLAGVSTACM